MTSFDGGRAKPSKGMIALALLAVYILWGSTYLAIYFAIDTIPPFTMAGVRFTLAGWILYAVYRMRGYPAPSRTHWISATVIGLLLLGVGNGGVTWAEQRVATGVAALIVASTPAWMVLLDWIRPGGVRPRIQVLVGVALGLAGIVVLVGARGDLRVEPVDTIGALAVMLASFGWALGSIISRSIAVPSSAVFFTSMQMIVAGVALLLLGLIWGEWGRVDLGGVTTSSVLALGYLIVFGSWIGFSAYIWLLRSTTPAIASTYAYVNPGVAVLLGWAFAGESVEPLMLLAMAIIIGGVMLISLPSSGSRAGKEGAPPPEGR